MNNNLLLPLLVGCTILVAGCSIIEPIPIEDVISSGTEALSAVSTLSSQAPSAPIHTAFIQMGGNGLFVNGDSLPSEEIAAGITAYYTSNEDKDLRMIVTPKSADLILKHYITLDSAAVLSAGMTVTEIASYADGRSPLYYQSIDPNQQDGLGYYFVTDGRILAVHFVRGVTDHVGYVGQAQGIVFFTDEKLMERSTESDVKFLLDKKGVLTRYQEPVQSEASSSSSAASSAATSSRSTTSSKASSSSRASSTASSRAPVSSRPVTSTAPAPAPSPAPVISSTWTPPPAQSVAPSQVEIPPDNDYDDDDDDYITNADVTIE